MQQSAFFPQQNSRPGSPPAPGSPVHASPSSKQGCTAGAQQAAWSNSIVAFGGGVRFPSSRRYLWDKTPAGPQILIALQEHLPHVQLAASVAGGIACAAKQRAGGLPLQLSLSVTPTQQVTALVQEFDPLGGHPAAAAGDGSLQLSCSLSADPLQVQQQAGPLRAALQAQLNQRDCARLQQLYALAASATPAASPAGAATLQLALLMPDVDLLAAPLYSKRLCNVPLAQALLSPGQMKPGETGYLTMDQARSLVPLEATDANVFSTPLVGVWVAGPGSVQHPLVAAACLRFAYSSLLMDRAVAAQDGSFLLLLCPEGDPVSKCYDVVPAQPEMQLAMYTLQASLGGAASTHQRSGLVRTDWTRAVLPQLQPLPGPVSHQATTSSTREEGSRLAAGRRAGALPAAADSPVLQQLLRHQQHGSKAAWAGAPDATRSSAPSAVGWAPQQWEQEQQWPAAGIAARRSLPLTTGQGFSGSGGSVGWEAAAGASPEPRQRTATVPFGQAGGGSAQQQQQQQWLHLGEQLLQEPQGLASAAGPQLQQAQPPHDAGAAGRSRSPVMRVQHPAMAPADSRDSPAGQAAGRAAACSSQAGPPAVAEAASGASPGSSMQQHHPQQQQQQQSPGEAALSVVDGDADDADCRPRLGSPVRPHRQQAAADRPSSSHPASSSGWQLGEGREPVSPSVRAGVALSNLTLLQHLSSGQLRQALDTVGSPDAAAGRLQQQGQGRDSAAAGASWPQQQDDSWRGAGAAADTSTCLGAAAGGAAAGSSTSYRWPQEFEPPPASGWRSPGLSRHMLASPPPAAAAAGGSSHLRVALAAAGCRASASGSAAAAAVSAAAAAVQRIPSGPYARSLGAQRYAADTAALHHSYNSDTSRPELGWGPAAAGLRGSLVPASPESCSSLPPSVMRGGAGQAGPAAASTAGLLESAGQMLHAYNCPSGSMMLQQVQQQQLARASLRDPMAAALQEQVERLRRQLAQLQQQFQAAGLPTTQPRIAAPDDDDAGGGGPSSSAAAAQPAGPCVEQQQQLPASVVPALQQQQQQRQEVRQLGGCSRDDAADAAAARPAESGPGADAARHTSPQACGGSDASSAVAVADLAADASAVGAVGADPPQQQQQQQQHGMEPAAQQGTAAAAAHQHVAAVAAAGGSGASSQQRDQPPAPSAAQQQQPADLSLQATATASRRLRDHHTDSSCSSSDIGTGPGSEAGEEVASAAHNTSLQQQQQQEPREAGGLSSPVTARPEPPAAAQAAGSSSSSSCGGVGPSPGKRRAGSAGAASLLLLRSSLEVPPLVELVRTKLPGRGQAAGGGEGCEDSDDSDREFEERLMVKYGLKA